MCDSAGSTWECRVKIHFEENKSGKSEEVFGDLITRKDMVAPAVTAAQNKILQSGPIGPDGKVIPLKFSRNVICVDIRVSASRFRDPVFATPSTFSSPRFRDPLHVFATFAGPLRARFLRLHSNKKNEADPPLLFGVDISIFDTPKRFFSKPEKLFGKTFYPPTPLARGGEGEGVLITLSRSPSRLVSFLQIMDSIESSPTQVCAAIQK